VILVPPRVGEPAACCMNKFGSRSTSVPTSLKHSRMRDVASAALCGNAAQPATRQPGIKLRANVTGTASAATVSIALSHAATPNS